MAELSRVINEKTIGKLETKGQTMEMGEMEIENGVDTRNSRSVAKSEGGNHATNLETIQGQSKGSRSCQVWPSKNFSEEVC